METGLPLGPLESARIPVARSGRGVKWHVLAAQKWARCSFAAEIEHGDQVALLDLEDVCQRCGRLLVDELPAAAAAYYRVVLYVVRARRWVAGLAAAAPTMTWLALSHWRANSPFSRDAAWRDAVDQLSGLDAAQLRTTASRVWQELAEQAERALATGVEVAGAAGIAAYAAHARTRLDQDREIAEQSRRISAIAADGVVLPYNVWMLASTAWEQAVAAGADEEATRAAMLTAVEHRYRNRPVRDVSLLPDPATTTGTGYRSPADWAAAEFAHLRATTVTHWADRLDSSLRDTELAARDDQERLLLITPWPPLQERDAEIAYLIQYPHLLRFSADPSRLHRLPGPRPWPMDPRTEKRTAVPAAVLRVPGAAARHAVTAAAQTGHHVHIADDVAPELDTPACAEAARELARTVAFYLDGDADDDPSQTPSPEVAQRRRDLRRTALPGIPHRSMDGDKPITPRELARSWSLGAFAWIPDEPPPPPGVIPLDSTTMPQELGTLDGLARLADHPLRHDRPVLATVETGRFPHTRIIDLTAPLTAVTADGIHLAPHEDDIVTVPPHRIVAVRMPHR
ncbi:hypothetical protein [Amycolatopsis anabasis]|uniref:hypothetical protein n=1 Tax=Amycolatopsis anabasis TaxID=1840409 RepID=UPI00131B416A|nr:hypothetical protein [Amycolatopsis anabasis]